MKARSETKRREIGRVAGGETEARRRVAGMDALQLHGRAASETDGEDQRKEGRYETVRDDGKGEKR